MKKITLTLAAIAAAFTMNAQNDPFYETSFETAEGYTSGTTIDDQNNWYTFTDSDPNYFVISNANSSEGSNSLLFESDGAGFTNEQGQALLDGPYKILETSGDVIYSFDVFLESPEAGETASTFVFTTNEIVQGPNGASIGDRTSGIYMTVNNGQNVIAAYVPNSTPGGPNQLSILDNFTYDTWYTIEVRHYFDDNEIEYFIDGTSVGSLPSLSSESIGIMLPYFTNDDTDVYLDNIVFGDSSTLSTNNFETNQLTHYTNNGMLMIDAEAQLENVEIYSILGKKVGSEILNGNKKEFI